MARGAARALQDSAGGMIMGPGAPSVLVNSMPISVMGDVVAGHGDNQHSSAAMLIGGPRTVIAGGKQVVVQGDPATCGHICTGSGNVLIG
jgi:uncharacterized Zn-binding protein involved in type VI secretion